MENKEDRTQDIIDFWNSFAANYEASQEVGSMQSAIILYNFCKPRTDKDSISTKEPCKILEVGVGPGRASRMFISSIMEKGAVYFN